MQTARFVVGALLIAALSACLTDESTENEGRPPGGDRFVIVHLTDDGLELASEVVAGTVSFEIENNGAREHGFAIEGPGVSERIEGLGPLDREVLTVNPRTGDLRGLLADRRRSRGRLRGHPRGHGATGQRVPG
jgi:hypothetical protein